MTFSVDLTSASAGEWFLDGQALKASSAYVIRCDGTRHTVTICSVPASLHGAELKFVANGIESSIHMEVRGRGTLDLFEFCVLWGWEQEDGGPQASGLLESAGGLLGVWPG